MGKPDNGSNASSQYVPESDDGTSAGGSSKFSGSAAAVAPCPPPSAVCLMPAIGAPRPAAGGKGRHPTDAELKQQIAALQHRAAFSYNPDRSATLCHIEEYTCCKFCRVLNMVGC